MQSISVIPLPAFDDNYLWLLHDGRSACVVDPGDAAVVNQALTQHRLTLSGILVTHHHGDHTGGVVALAAQHAVPVWGPHRERIAGITQALAEGEELLLPALNLPLHVMEVPGHTSGHIAYYAPAAQGRAAPLLFCGDTLFSGGCGRLFEGTPAQMFASLARLAALPDDTEVYCTHEYTLANLAFCKAAEPENTQRDEYQAWCLAQRALGLPTLPSSIARERRINAFLRCDQPHVQAAISAHAQRSISEPLETFTFMREWKNLYKAV